MIEENRKQKGTDPNQKPLTNENVLSYKKKKSVVSSQSATETSKSDKHLDNRSKRKKGKSKARFVFRTVGIKIHRDANREIQGGGRYFCCPVCSEKLKTTKLLT